MAGESPSVPRTDLERLLATERRLAVQLTAARGACDAAIAEAEAQANAREQALDAELEREQRRLSDSLVEEQRQGERETAATADRQVAAFAAIPPDVVTVLARKLALRFLTREDAR
jgi:hypothetical protein